MAVNDVGSEFDLFEPLHDRDRGLAQLLRDRPRHWREDDGMMTLPEQLEPEVPHVGLGARARRVLQVGDQDVQA